MTCMHDRSNDVLINRGEYKHIIIRQICKKKSVLFYFQ